MPEPRPDKLATGRRLAALPDAVIDARLRDPAGLDRLLAAVLPAADEPEEPGDRWDGLA